MDKGISLRVAPPGPGPAKRQLRMIVIDDEPSILFALREYFTAGGTLVDCVSGFTEAIRLLDQNPYDIVITDLHLTANRRAEGLLVLEVVRHRRPRARTIVLTGFASNAVSHEAFQHGADACFPKPIDLSTLNEVVNRLVSQGPRPIAQNDRSFPPRPSRR